MCRIGPSSHDLWGRHPLSTTTCPPTPDTRETCTYRGLWRFHHDWFNHWPLVINSISSLSPQSMKNEAESSMFPIKAWSFLRLAPILAYALWGLPRVTSLEQKTLLLSVTTQEIPSIIEALCQKLGTKTNYFSMIPHHLSLTVDSNMRMLFTLGCNPLFSVALHMRIQ